jgi:NAD(P)-dependent dehydrogenase (short-subunit alcohol dehydrogenase family)
MQNQRDVYWDDLKPSFSGELDGKVAIVTGGGRGIGRAITENLLKNKAKVVVVTRKSGKDLAQMHPNCSYISCDVRDSANVERAVQKVGTELGAIDILINCAGYAFLTAAKDEPEALFDQIMDTNFKGVRNFIVASAAYLEESHGCIISLGSIWALPGINLPGDSTYSAGDAAIIKYSEVVAEELRSVRINTVSPALVETSMNDDMTAEAKQEFAQSYKNRKNLIQPEEIAKVVESIIKSNLTQKNVIIDAGYIKR